jgi:spermidine synthase
VVEREDGTRVLELNEGQAVHSLYRPGEYLTGDYWDGHLVLPAAADPAPPRRIAILGNAGGTVARSFGHYFPQTAVDAVEIDSELTELGRRYLGLRNRRMQVFAEDARPWLQAAEGGYDAIMVDAYRQPYIPFYLTTREFFALTRERLDHDGVTIVNVGHPEGGDELERVLGRTLASVYPRVLRYPIETTNTLLVAGGEGLSAGRLRRAAAGLPPDLRPLAREAAAKLEPRLPGGEVYTDDHAPVEWLVDSSLLDYANG